MTLVEQFIRRCSELATQCGIRNLIIAVQIPLTGELKLVSSPGAKEALQPKVFEWYGVPVGVDVEALKKENESLKVQLASLGGDTGWEA
jgi:hypothetical protein